MPQKPRRRKKNGIRASLVISVVVVLAIVGAVGWYAYGGLGGQASTATTTSSILTTTVASTTSTALSGCPNPPSSVTSNLVYARINTTMGPIEVELFSSAAPKTVTNFVGLANAGFFNNLVWHRIVKGFVIQTGDPLTRNAGGDRSLWGTGGSGTTVPLEIDSVLHNYVCYLGMARGQDPNSGSSQFYINLANNTSLDGSYTVFGRVVSGLGVVNQIGNVQVNSSDQPVNPIFVTSVTVLSSGP